MEIGSDIALRSALCGSLKSVGHKAGCAGIIKRSNNRMIKKIISLSKFLILCLLLLEIYITFAASHHALTRAESFIC